ncbi:hypothetical protein [Bacillus sp. AFS040349]|uniref:hypothetical protein n=1 Tax=Bacillus sp. AFS040349 TaxID=2033502 RepID=UPI000BFDD008|nr:hypothetical protein [Bacillus sp. AFS040349]PGT83251.1 hypothetical protein COD11_13020 [Bacillus sp. AFS040349]
MKHYVNTWINTNKNSLRKFEVVCDVQILSESFRDFVLNNLEENKQTVVTVAKRTFSRKIVISIDPGEYESNKLMGFFVFKVGQNNPICVSRKKDAEKILAELQRFMSNFLDHQIEEFKG